MSLKSTSGIGRYAPATALSGWHSAPRVGFHMCGCLADAALSLLPRNRFYARLLAGWSRDAGGVSGRKVSKARRRSEGKGGGTLARTARRWGSASSCAVGRFAFQL